MVAGEQNVNTNGPPHRSPPYAFYVAAIAILSASIIFGLSMWVFGDLFKSASTVTSALGSLFTLIGTIVGAYFGIKVSNDTSERSQGAIERAHGSAEEANQRAEQAHDTAQQALAELDPDVARRILQGR
jgi:hypothetical protein